jgi:hypothetical protein
MEIAMKHNEPGAAGRAMDSASTRLSRVFTYLKFVAFALPVKRN